MFWSSDWSYTVDLPFRASFGPSAVIHSGNVPNSFPFRFCDISTLLITQLLCLVVVCRILSWSLMFSILLSIPRWLVSNVPAIITNHVFHLYAVADKKHWLKAFRCWLMGRYLSRRISLCFQKTLYSAFILIETSFCVWFSIAIVCSRYSYSFALSISVLSICMLSVLSRIWFFIHVS